MTVFAGKLANLGVLEEFCDVAPGTKSHSCVVGRKGVEGLRGGDIGGGGALNQHQGGGCYWRQP